MHIKEAYDEMIKAKSNLDDAISDFLTNPKVVEQFPPREIVAISRHFRQLSNNMIKPFSE